MPNPTVELLPLLRQSGAAVERRACGIRLDIGRQRISGPDFERLVAFGEKREILAA